MRFLPTYSVPALSTWSEKLVPRLSNREYRHAYMAEGVKTWIARQVRALREQRGWNQGDLARESGKKQSAISRIEDPDYGQLSLQTLFDLAATFDLPLVVQFSEWPEWLNRMEDVSTEALQKESFDGEHLASLASQQYTNAGESVLTIYARNAAVSALSTNYDSMIERMADEYYNWELLDQFEPKIIVVSTPEPVKKTNYVWSLNLPPETVGSIGHG